MNPRYRATINEVFDALDNCKLCAKHCTTGTAKAEHARKHVREGKAIEIKEPERKFTLSTPPSATNLD